MYCHAIMNQLQRDARVKRRVDALSMHGITYPGHRMAGLLNGDDV